MIFNLALVIFTWIALRLEKKDLDVLGLRPVPERFVQLVLGLSLTIALSIFVNLLFSQSANFEWVRNPHFNVDQIPSATYRTFNSVVFEELIFRAYALYKLNKLFREKVAVFSTSIAFGIYHWFTMGALGNFAMMIWVFFYTGLWGAMFAYCFTRTGTVLLGTGLHWGWNFLEQVVFVKQGEGLLKPLTSTQTQYLNLTAGIIVTTLPPILFAVAVILFLVKRNPVRIQE
jgi:membrane protease YdiL (CAAX protease family)